MLRQAPVKPPWGRWDDSPSPRPGPLAAHPSQSMITAPPLSVGDEPTLGRGSDNFGATPSRAHRHTPVDLRGYVSAARDAAETRATAPAGFEGEGGSEGYVSVARGDSET